MNPGFRCSGADVRQRAVDVRFADVSVVYRVAHGGGGVNGWAGMCYVDSEHRRVLLIVY